MQCECVLFNWYFFHTFKGVPLSVSSTSANVQSGSSTLKYEKLKMFQFPS